MDVPFSSITFISLAIADPRSYLEVVKENNNYTLKASSCEDRESFFVDKKQFFESIIAPATYMSSDQKLFSGHGFCVEYFEGKNYSCNPDHQTLKSCESLIQLYSSMVDWQKKIGNFISENEVTCDEVNGDGNLKLDPTMGQLLSKLIFEPPYTGPNCFAQALSSAGVLNEIDQNRHVTDEEYSLWVNSPFCSKTQTPKAGDLAYVTNLKDGKSIGVHGLVFLNNSFSISRNGNNGYLQIQPSDLPLKLYGAMDADPNCPILGAKVIPKNEGGIVSYYSCDLEALQDSKQEWIDESNFMAQNQQLSCLKELIINNREMLPETVFIALKAIQTMALENLSKDSEVDQDGNSRAAHLFFWKAIYSEVQSLVISYREKLSLDPNSWDARAKHLDRLRVLFGI